MYDPTRLIVATLTATALFGFATAASAETGAGQEHPKFELIGGASSPDALVNEFLQALAARDEVRLHTLRVTEREYRDVIIPGTVKEGQPPRVGYAKADEYFWLQLDTKSRDFARTLLSNFGGHQYRLKRLFYSDPNGRRYAWYRAYGEVRLEVEDGDGTPELIKTGWIAEIGGRCKFIGFDWEN